MSQQGHLESVAGARAQLEEVSRIAVSLKATQHEMLGLVAALIESMRSLQEQTAVLKDQQQTALTLMEVATGGGDCNSANGRNAFEYTIVLGQNIDEFTALLTEQAEKFEQGAEPVGVMGSRIDEFTTACDNTIQSLDNYGAGW